MNYLFTVQFEADNIEAAENRAANWLQGMAHKGRGTGLYYRDGCSGDWALWSEPACTPSELAAKRDRS